MNILVIGSGGREHALAWKLKQSPKVKKIFTALGNPGTAGLGENISIDISNHRAIIECVKKNEIHLVIVGSDGALASGVVNSLQDAGIKVFGPTKEAAEIEWSKSFAKELLERLNIPTARSRTFTDIANAKEYIQDHEYPLVIKASGLALGKGVIIAQTQEEAEQALISLKKPNKIPTGASTIAPGIFGTNFLNKKRPTMKIIKIIRVINEVFPVCLKDSKVFSKKLSC